MFPCRPCVRAEELGQNSGECRVSGINVCRAWHDCKVHSRVTVESRWFLSVEFAGKNGEHFQDVLPFPG